MRCNPEPSRNSEPSRLRSTLYAAIAVLTVAACSDDAGLPDARLPIDAALPGQFTLTWSLSHGGGPQSCASVGATSVSVELLPVGSAFGEVDGWSCASGTGTTRPLEPGLYDVYASVSGGGTLDGPIVRRGVELRPGQTTTVEPIVFDVEPTGTLVFRVTTPSTGGNCAALAAMGAGITATTLELRDSAGTCVPTTFAISAGATAPAGSYTSDCAGASYACLDADQDVTATMVASGSHTMALTGSIGAAACWKRTSQFTTRAGGLTTTLNPQQLQLDSQVPGCPAP